MSLTDGSSERGGAAALADGRSAVARSIGFMLLSTLMLSIMHALVRHASASVDPIEIAFLRNFLGLLFLAPLFLRTGIAPLRSRRPWLQLLRGSVGTASMIAWYYGLSTVPLAEATALSFVGVVFSSIFAVLFLGERMRVRRWTAVGVSFVGAAVILRPGFTELSLGVLAVVFSAGSWGISVVLVKQLSKVDSPLCTVTWMSVTLSVLSMPPALLVWTWPTGEQLVYLGLIAILATLGHLALAKALQLADATLLMPLDFVRLVWAGVAGYLAFAEVPDGWTLLGSALIVASAIYIMHREAVPRVTSAAAVEPR